jgi:D-3-phosphoglycerate dehydrogenase / 2-oxoglutarate reductase
MAGTVLLTDHVFGGLAHERKTLGEIGCTLEEAPDTEEATLAALAGDASAVMVCFAQITAPVIEAAAEGGCRIISRYGVGVDNIDVEAATRAGILVTYVPDYCLDEVADHAMALVLSVARRVVAGNQEVTAGGWKIPYAGIRRLQGRRMALIGVGRIGRKVADRARAFGFEVVGYDPYVEDWSGTGITGAASVEEAVAEADVISLHAPLTDETEHIIDDHVLSLMGHAPVLVNTSRGGLVDTDAVVRALDDGRLSAAALDVTDPEPLPDGHPLRTHEHAIITPHMSFASVEATEELQRRATDEVVRALTGEPPRCPVNPEVVSGAT